MIWISQMTYLSWHTAMETSRAKARVQPEMLEN
ncbi:hypothetical protein NP493_2066g00029 [Ridgeia piscesae]|uniref:Uncharacterized protein n=1 Tax=Ridgeia piscesae TaxID=27915 RepID=A0AAD9N5Y3_RIDPI|nr:hypothetical protein NP493_2066g00029 [Ridgeia piscesae]